MAVRSLNTRILLGLCAVATLPLAACNDYGSRPGYSSDRHYDRSGRRGDDRRGHYLGDNDRIYRDRDGRYYCKKPDGSTGLIVGGLAGGVLGNIIAPGDSKTLGTILGAGAGAIAGRAIDRNNVRCE
ncbi:MAG: hypothetical protein B7Z20_04465 [Sphingobium sp. 32-64-5]|nr:MAG: hypothetical protein B7Z20_04465 [Sphingobium sp. 32-64-5]